MQPIQRRISGFSGTSRVSSVYHGGVPSLIGRLTTRVGPECRHAKHQVPSPPRRGRQGKSKLQARCTWRCLLSLSPLAELCGFWRNVAWWESHSRPMAYRCSGCFLALSLHANPPDTGEPPSLQTRACQRSASLELFELLMGNQSPRTCFL